MYHKVTAYLLNTCGARGLAECDLGAQMTGAPPPEEATTLHRSPPGCTWFTIASIVLQRPDGPSQFPALTLKVSTCSAFRSLLNIDAAGLFGRAQH